MARLEGKTAVITGGASGIGEATVRLFAAEGARVVIADIQDGAGERLASDLGGSAVYQHTDVTSEDDIRAAIARAMKEFGRLDCIFNNAGIVGAVGPIEDTPAEEYDRTMAVLLRSVFLGMKHAAPIMKAQRSGSIISTASVAGVQAGDGPHVYATAKAAIIHLTKSVALELSEHNVRVNCICPGGIATPLLTPVLPAGDGAMDVVKAALAQFQPIPRAGLPEDIAQAALWLAGDDSTFVSGHALVVDGAMTAGRRWSQQPAAVRTHTPMA